MNLYRCIMPRAAAFLESLSHVKNSPSRTRLRRHRKALTELGGRARRQSACLLLLLFFSLFSPGSGLCWADFTLPAQTRRIGEEAFCGLETDQPVLLPEGIEELGSRAFAEGAFMAIRFPASLRMIAADAFEGVRTPLLIEAEPDTEAVSFALARQLDFRADTVCRALLIGQSAYSDGRALQGTTRDLLTMSRLLKDFTVTQKTNLTAAEILSNIAETFAEAKKEDISLIYYAGHGLRSDNPAENGALVGIDSSSYVTGAQLRQALDALPGRIIVLIDSCWSGGLFADSPEDAGAAPDAVAAASVSGGEADPAADFIRAFTAGDGLKRAAKKTQQQLFIMVSSSPDEESWETYYGGVFTQAFSAARSAGDYNGDGVVSFEEAHHYTAENAMRVVSAEGLSQSVQAWPANCYWFGMFRNHADGTQ